MGSHNLDIHIDLPVLCNVTDFILYLPHKLVVRVLRAFFSLYHQALSGTVRMFTEPSLFIQASDQSSHCCFTAFAHISLLSFQEIFTVPVNSFYLQHRTILIIGNGYIRSPTHQNPPLHLLLIA